MRRQERTKSREKYDVKHEFQNEFHGIPAPQPQRAAQTAQKKLLVIQTFENTRVWTLLHYIDQ